MTNPAYSKNPKTFRTRALTPRQVLRIRKQHVRGGKNTDFGTNYFADLYQVDRDTIVRLVNRRTWDWLTDISQVEYMEKTGMTIGQAALHFSKTNK